MATEQKPSLSLLHPAKLIGTWFGSGLAPKASGTAGSLAALPFAYVIQSQWGNDALLLASLLVFALGWWATAVYLRHTDSTDPKEIVVDEVAGQWLLLSFLYPAVNSYLVGFILFRFFDVLKPWPVSWSDRSLKGGLGVMLDDMLAALYPVVLVGMVYLLGTMLSHPVNFRPLLHVLEQ